MLRDFANDMGWRPSYYLIEPPLTSQYANAHLVVEHGLQPSAVITFLDKSHRLADIRLPDLHQLLSISYNNLVDWHLYVEPDEITFCFNRKKPLYTESRRISRSDYDSLRNEAFDQIVGRKPTPNLPSLDQALIETISSWRRVLSAELRYAVPTVNLSALFNAILFARTIEDQNRRIEPSSRQLLLEEWGTAEKPESTLRAVILSAMRKIIGTTIPKFLIDEDKLAVFDSLDSSTIHALLADFYLNRFAPYSYDFSVMSKHALSRIYEHYTALLHVEESAQMAFIPRLPEEEWNKRHGSIYTPQFIARYFARFLRNQLPPKLFRQTKTIDPACGSGIFLRTLLELQCDPLQDSVTSDSIRQAFSNAHGWDIDENATNATIYSLASLYLVLTNSLPTQLNVQTVESIAYYQEHTQIKESFDSVISNPPFVALGTQPDEFRQRVALFMGEEAKGRTDTYLAFLKLGLELIKPGGYGLFVLPHSFLLAGSARSLRRRINSECWIHCLADLSAIRVFEDLGSYIILLIFQKKASFVPAKPSTTIVKCQDYVGLALEDSLEGRSTETPSYSIYEVDQKEFERDNWVILPSKESIIRDRLESLPRLSEFTEIREGLITGADNIFILDESRVPKGEESLYAPFLPDREMERYNVPADTGKRVLYPFLDGRKLSQDEIQHRFTKTWEYLVVNKQKLENRLPVRRGNLKWWEPVRPRSPELLFRPKIVSPHLILIPRFSLDEAGKYAISRTCYLYPKTSDKGEDLLRYLVAILNSPVCHWYISTHSHKYSRGYTMLEPKTLKSVPIPNPAGVPVPSLEHLLSLVDRRLKDRSALFLESEIDDITGQLYGLTPVEQQVIGVR
jgi:methylase of polypeptide subunit release factors